RRAAALHGYDVRQRSRRLSCCGACEATKTSASHGPRDRGRYIDRMRSNPRPAYLWLNLLALSDAAETSGPLRPTGPPIPSTQMTNSADHVQAGDARQAAIYREMTPRARLEQALRMNRSMRRLLAAGLRAQHLGWDEAQVRREVARRILHARTG